MRCLAAGLKGSISICVNKRAQLTRSWTCSSDVSLFSFDLISRTMVAGKKKNRKSVDVQPSSSVSTKAHHTASKNVPQKQVWAQKPPNAETGLKVNDAIAGESEAVEVNSQYTKSNEKEGSKTSHPSVRARVRATFYPKFENEKSDQEVRIKVIQVVTAGKGVLEVSLKHSGSLFLYSGGPTGGAFAKNSYGNLYTAVGIFVLGRVLKEAWGAQSEEKQREFNAYLQKEHLSVAMELVTAVLGDHGQRPIQDYVVVTAVADLKGRPTFYSTADVVAFCHQWRLPTNHVWLFSTKNSVLSFFSAYDALCEEGTATTVAKVLDELSDVNVPGMKSHQELQGEILEGLVARVVDPASISSMNETLHKYPVPKMSDGLGVDMGPDLRTIIASNRASEEKQILSLLEHAGQGLCANASDWVGDKNPGHDTKQLETFLKSSPVDAPTLKLQELCGTLRSRKLPVRFKCRSNFDGTYSTSETNEPTSFRMTIHVLSDSAFRRYQQEMRKHPGLWPLYRGFFVDVDLLSKTETSSNVEDVREAMEELSVDQPSTQLPSEDEGENLMVKLKFLPYKLRTFLIRNGLPILLNKGVGEYKSYYMKQMKNWGTSAPKQRELVQLLDEWAVYARKHIRDKNVHHNYLTVAEPFLERFAQRSAKNQRLVGSAGSLVNIDDIVLLSDERSDDEESTPFESTTSSKPTSENTIETITAKKAKGMLVFFPGIPGSAKSALCEEIRKISEFGDQQHLMGDLTKGKYWQKIGELRKKNPHAITLADKNAPNQEVWIEVESICEKSLAIGVPVIVDSAGTECNPYSIDALAVFMYRVLQRAHHPGKLDKNSPNAGAVLLLFYNLYNGRDRKEFEEALLSSFGHVVTMPFLKADRKPLPVAVLDVVNRGIDLQKQHIAKHGRLESTKGTFKNAWAEWETQLRETLTLHAKYLNEIQIPLLDAVKSVVDQLFTITKSDFLMHEGKSPEERSFNTFTYAAVKLPQDKLQMAIETIMAENSEVRSYLDAKGWKERLGHSHVTLAHKAVHGVAAVAQYGSLRASPSSVKISAILFSDKLCALEVQLGSDKEPAIKSLNTWPHVTIWTGDGMKAKDANALPELALKGQAKRVVFTEPVNTVGTIEFF